MQKWLDDNDILMYLTHNEGKLVDEYNNTYHSIGKKPVYAVYSTLTKESLAKVILKFGQIKICK